MISAKIVDYKSETSDICVIEIERNDGQCFTSYSGGAHIDVRTPAGLIRQYSLCGEDHSGRFMTIAVKKDPNSRGGSRSVHEDLRLGSVIEVSEPRSHFKIAAAESHHILIAAGIGITPLLSMAYECLRLKKTFELHYFSRSLESTAFRERLMQEDFSNRVSFYHEADREKIDKLIERAVSSDPAAHIYTCGPGAFMDKVISIASNTRSSDHVHKEAFGAQTSATALTNNPFTLRLAQSELTVEVGASESIVDALAKCGIEIPTSCGEGVCGTCLIPVSCGQIDHRDNLLTDEEKAQGDMMCACVSRAKESEITLDL